MSQTKHTPGPWHVEGDHVVTTDHMAKQLIAWPVEGPYALPYPERRANAHLIAAAPDMLSALQEALEELGTIDGNIADGRETYVSTTVIKAIEQAIAKALGKGAAA